MRNLIWLILAAAVLLGGYMLISGKSINDIMGAVTNSVEITVVRSGLSG